jgi:hypothetical protein
MVRCARCGTYWPSNVALAAHRLRSRNCNIEDSTSECASISAENHGGPSNSVNECHTDNYQDVAASLLVLTAADSLTADEDLDEQFEEELNEPAAFAYPTEEETQPEGPPIPTSARMEWLRFFRLANREAGLSIGDIRHFLKIIHLPGLDMSELKDWHTEKDVEKYAEETLGEFPREWKSTMIDDPIIDEAFELRYVDAKQVLIDIFSAPENKPGFVLKPGLEREEDTRPPPTPGEVRDPMPRIYSRPENSDFWISAQV